MLTAKVLVTQQISRTESRFDVNVIGEGGFIQE